MVDSMDIYRSLNINIGTVMRNTEMLKFVSDHLKTKQMCKQMCNKAILENGGTLKPVSDC